jgi:hypothetical protein
VSSTTAGTGYTGTVSWSGSPSTFAGATVYTATITLTPTSGYTLTGVSANFFTVAGATSVTHSADSGVITAEFPATRARCDGSGSPCGLGSIGPGGGFIYYYSAAGFKCGATYTSIGSPTGGLCHYLEVAPSGWNQDINDPSIVWAAISNSDVSEITNTSTRTDAYNNAAAIGLGYKNSIAIVSQNNVYNPNSYAAGLARAYSGGTLTDWYLPTSAELNLLCQWNRGVAIVTEYECSNGSLNSATFGAETAGFLAERYWSSSEFDSTRAWFLRFSVPANATHNTGHKFELEYTLKYLRPVRSF